MSTRLVLQIFTMIGIRQVVKGSSSSGGVAIPCMGDFTLANDGYCYLVRTFMTLVFEALQKKIMVTHLYID